MITFPYEGAGRIAERNYYDRNGLKMPKVVPASLFYRDEDFGIGSIPFDLLVDESHELEFDISEHTVEGGSSVSDHVQQRLRRVQVNGLFTNHSIDGRKSGYVNYGSEKQDGSIEMSTKPDVVEIDGVQGVGNDALDMMFEAVKELARSREPVRVVTSLEVYPEMVFESLKYARGPEDGESIKFTAELREIKTAEVETTFRDGVWNPPQPKDLSTEAAKKMARNQKDGKLTGIEQPLSKLDQATEGTLLSYGGDL